MVEIGGRPILWHIMQIYSHYGYKDFLIACGYKGELIKEYFCNYAIHSNDYFIDLSDGSREVVNTHGVDWRVGVIDTGLETATGGRLLRLTSWLRDGPFMVTYGDGLADLDLRALVAFHRRHGKLATVTAVRPPSRFGALFLEDERVAEFSEKPQAGEGWINGGFFVFEPAVLDYIRGDQTILEREVLERLAIDQQLMAFRHPGFWQPMDTQREKEILQSLWAGGAAPWHKPSPQPTPLTVPSTRLAWREWTA
jgi:glucose-1-phosphate cytidylyltransferase